MNRSVLVTGGSSGIGLAIARALAADGDKVAVTYHASSPPEGLLGVKCDVTDPAAVDEAVCAVEAEHGPVEVLVCCAGITQDTLFLRMSDEDFSTVVDTNLTGAFRVSRRAVRGMMSARWGRLIFISSVVALRGSPGQANYAASKAGLVGLARSLARELASRGITSNVVLPGFIPTAITDRLPEKVRAAALAEIPAARYGSPDEVAAAVRFLASDAAGYVTGSLIPVDGGLGMGN